mmetsp:Transcript_12606/g.49088  ORF Transcript_12606/g.49088 Transcript_12606/m.49088 type:complete len:344 (+) Transcript_12606:874-1905(+)
MATRPCSSSRTGAPRRTRRPSSSAGTPSGSRSSSSASSRANRSTSRSARRSSTAAPSPSTSSAGRTPAETTASASIAPPFASCTADSASEVCSDALSYYSVATNAPHACNPHASHRQLLLALLLSPPLQKLHDLPLRRLAESVHAEVIRPLRAERVFALRRRPLDAQERKRDGGDGGNRAPAPVPLVHERQAEHEPHQDRPQVRHVGYGQPGGLDAFHGSAVVDQGGDVLLHRLHQLRRQVRLHLPNRVVRGRVPQLRRNLARVALPRAHGAYGLHRAIVGRLRLDHLHQLILPFHRHERGGGGASHLPSAVQRVVFGIRLHGFNLVSAQEARHLVERKPLPT